MPGIWMDYEWLVNLYDFYFRQEDIAFTRFPKVISDLKMVRSPVLYEQNPNNGHCVCTSKKIKGMRWTENADLGMGDAECMHCEGNQKKCRQHSVIQ